MCVHARVTCVRVYVCTCMCVCAGACARPRPQVRESPAQPGRKPQAPRPPPGRVRGSSFVTGGRGAVRPLQARSTGGPRPTLPSQPAPQLPTRPPLCLRPHPAPLSSQLLQPHPLLQLGPSPSPASPGLWADGLCTPLDGPGWSPVCPWVQVLGDVPVHPRVPSPLSQPHSDSTGGL